MYKIVLLSVLAVAAASPVNYVYTSGVNTPLVYSNGNQIIGQTQLVGQNQLVGQTQLVGQNQLVGQTQLVNNIPLTYTTSGIQTIQNPIVYSSGVQTIQNPVVLSSGVQTIQNPVVLNSGVQQVQQVQTVQQQQNPVVLTRTAGVQNIQTIPSVVSTGAKIQTSYEPVEQHGYSIAY